MHFWHINCFQDSLLIRPDYFRFFESSTAIEPINRRFAVCSLTIRATWLSKKSSLLPFLPVSFGFSFISFSNLVYLPKLHQSKVFFGQDDKQRAVVSNHTRFTTSCLFSKQQRAPAHFTHYFCGTHSRIRTCDLLLVKQTRWPTALCVYDAQVGLEPTQPYYKYGILTLRLRCNMYTQQDSNLRPFACKTNTLTHCVMCVWCTGRTRTDTAILQVWYPNP